MSIRNLQSSTPVAFEQSKLPSLSQEFSGRWVNGSDQTTAGQTLFIQKSNNVYHAIIEEFLLPITTEDDPLIQFNVDMPVDFWPYQIGNEVTLGWARSNQTDELRIVQIQFDSDTSRFQIKTQDENDFPTGNWQISEIQFSYF